MINNEKDVAIFAGVAFPVGDWPPMPEIAWEHRFCVCGARFTPTGRCSVGYTAHRKAIERAHAA